jgi:hypothetical protein
MLPKDRKVMKWKTDDPHKTKLIACCLALSMSVCAFAREGTIPGSRYMPSKAEGMGDAFMPLADDGATSLYMNPAGLALLKEFNLEIFNVQLGANKDFTRTANLNAYKFSNLNNYKEALRGQQDGPYPGAGFVFAPSVSYPGIAIGGLYQVKLAAKAAHDQIYYRSLYQFVPAIGIGHTLAQGIVRIGYSLQWVNQLSGNTKADINSDVGFNKNIQKGSGFSHNFGLALTIPYTYVPQFNVVVRNIGKMNFMPTAILPNAADSVAGVPKDERMSIDTSLSMDYKIGNLTRLDLSVVNRDITGTSYTSLMTRLAMGARIRLFGLFDASVGYSSGYPAAGFGIVRSRGEFYMSWYTEEMGDSFRQHKNEKFTIQYQSRVF